MRHVTHLAMWARLENALRTFGEEFFKSIREETFALFPIFSIPSEEGGDVE
jgi:hypothetical protein